MLRVEIIGAGKLKERFWREACEAYVKRLSGYCALKIIEIPDEKAPEGLSDREKERILSREGGRILSAAAGNGTMWALDIRGESMDSETFSAQIDKLAVEGESTLQLVIGGSYGLSQEVLKAADRRISFSEMTFPHQLMRVILLEQLYRAFKIMRKEPYHK